MRTLAVAAALALLGVGALLLWSRGAPAPRARAASSAAAEEAPARDSIPSEARSTSNGASDAGGPALDRAKADEMREKIRALLADAGPLWGSAREPVAPSPAAARPGVHRNPDGTYAEMPADDADGGAELRQYIQSRVREDLFPLAKDCYASELEKDPRLGGRLVVRFTIAGDKRVGGVVDSVTVGDGSTLTRKSFVDCVTESMMSVSFDAPPGGGTLTVSYPIRFSPDEPDAESDR